MMAGERLVLLFVIGALLINFPILAIFNRAGSVGGVPVLYVYLFGIWAIGIILVLIMARKTWDDEG